MDNIYMCKEMIKCDDCKKEKYVWDFSTLRVFDNCEKNQCHDCFFKEND